MGLFLSMASTKKYTAAKWARYVLPVLKAVSLGKLDLEKGMLKDSVEALAELGGDEAKEKLKEFIKGKPDEVSELVDQHLIRHTGTVLGALVRQYAEKKGLPEHQADLKKLASATPEGWKEFIAENPLKLSALRNDVFQKQLAVALTPDANVPPLDPNDFVEFFRWLSKKKSLIGPLRAGLTPPLTRWLAKNLNQQLLIDLCKDNEDASAAFKESLLRFQLSAQGKLDLLIDTTRRTEHNLGVVAQQQMRDSQKLDRIEGDPGFDLDAYARAILRDLAPLPLGDIVRDSHTSGIAVTDVFVPLKVRAVPMASVRVLNHAKELHDFHGREKDHSAPEELKNRKKELESLLRSSPPVVATELISHDEGRNYILLGEPGGGKTLLARHLAVVWANRYLGYDQSAPAGRIPIYIELKHYASALDRQTVANYLDYVHCPHYPLHSLSKHVLDEHLDSHEAYLILDGLDEVLQKKIKRSLISDLIDGTGLECDVVLTSRIADFEPERWQNANLWYPYRIDPLDHTDQKIFIENYHRAFHLDERTRNERIARLQTKLRDFHRLAELAGTPLLLTLLCLTNRAGKLPETRCELYQASAELLLHNWDLYHFEDRETQEHFALQPLAEADKHAIIRRLAWLIMMGRPHNEDREHAVDIKPERLSGNLFPTSIVEEAVHSLLTQLNKPDVSRYVEIVPRLLIERNSVLCPASEDHQSFIHRTFLEFYAAWAWAKENATWLDKPKPVAMSAEQRFKKLYEPHWQDPAWRIVLVLHCGQVESDYAQELVQLMLDVSEHHRQRANRELAMGVAEVALNCANDALLLAAECFTETQHRSQHQDLSATLLEQLRSLAVYKWSLYHLVTAEEEEARERCVRSVRLLVQLWDDRSKLDAWLEQTVLNTDMTLEVRREIIQQMRLLQGPTEALRDLLHQLNGHPSQTAWVRNAVLQTLNEDWGESELLCALNELQSVPHLTELYLDNCTSLSAIPTLRGMNKLKNLALDNCTSLRDFSALCNSDIFSNLEALWLNGCTQLTTLPSLGALMELKSLFVSRCTGLQDIAALGEPGVLPGLQHLMLTGCTGLERVPTLAWLMTVRPRLTVIWDE